jgi:O-antigen ligase
VAETLDPWKGTIQTSLRRGATHNLLSDLLITYGVVGLVCYLFMCFALVRLCFALVNRPGLPAEVQEMALITGILGIFTVIYGVSAGGYLRDYIAWMVVTALARTAASVDLRQASAVTSEPATWISR